MISEVLKLRDTRSILRRVRLRILRERYVDNTWHGCGGQMTGKKVAGGEGLRDMIKLGFKIK